ncbi:hypothetical protein [Acetanaerobacterium elongatum]|nr:hypothetical protein [Acetanaerobacterium elongatum]
MKEVQLTRFYGSSPAGGRYRSALKNRGWGHICPPIRRVLQAQQKPAES